MAAEAGRKNSILTVLKSIVQEVNQIPRLTDALFRLAERVKQTMGVDSCSIYLADYNSQAFVLKATDGLAPDAVELVKIGFSEGLIGLVGQREEPLNIQDAPNHPRFKHYPEVKEESYHAFLGTPIIHQRKVLGVITMQQSARRKFSEDEEAFLVTLAAQIALEISHAETRGALNPIAGIYAGHMQKNVRGVPGSPGLAMGVGYSVLQCRMVICFFSAPASTSTFKASLTSFIVAMPLDITMGFPIRPMCLKYGRFVISPDGILYRRIFNSVSKSGTILLIVPF